MPLKQKAPGKLIAFEGSEGSGKSTQIQRLSKRIQSLGKEVLATREPGGTPIGEQIRNILVHNAAGDEMCAETELLLFAASRAQHVREVLAPALMRGAIVLCDRYLDSSTVYQGIARNLASDRVASINQFAVGNALPDLTIIIDVPTEVSIARVAQRPTDLPDRMERENIEFYKKVREGYLFLAGQVPGKYLVIDGTLSPDEIEQQIWAGLQRLVS